MTGAARTERILLTGWFSFRHGEVTGRGDQDTTVMCGVAPGPARPGAGSKRCGWYGRGLRSSHCKNVRLGNRATTPPPRTRPASSTRKGAVIVLLGHVGKVAAMAAVTEPNCSTS